MIPASDDVIILRGILIVCLLLLARYFWITYS